EAVTGVARTAVLDRSRVAGVRGVADHHLALAGEQRPVATVPGRKDAVEEVIPHSDEANQIARRADAHQIPRRRGGERAARRGGDAGGLRRRLADRPPADGVAVEAERGDRRRALRAERLVEAALDDAEERRPGSGAGGEPARGPRRRARHGRRNARTRDGGRYA